MEVGMMYRLARLAVALIIIHFGTSAFGAIQANGCVYFDFHHLPHITIVPSTPPQSLRYAKWVKSIDFWIPRSFVRIPQCELKQAFVSAAKYVG